MKEAFEQIKERLEEASFVDYDEHYTDNGECLVTISDALYIVSEVEAEYKDKFVFASVCEQIMWERDVAIAQLKELGYGLGEKIRKVEAEYGNGWIDVKDRLPENDGYYLTCDRKGNIHVFYHHPSYVANGRNMAFGICKNHPQFYQPIAWMELPKPYTGKKGE